MESRRCHFEKLPEDIRLHILQSLPLRDAVATSPVSQTWKNMWKRSCSQNLNLCFDVDNIIGVEMPALEHEKEFAPDLTYYRKGLTLKNGAYFGMCSEIIDDFVKGVDVIVQCHRAKEHDVLLGVKSLEIRFPLWGKHSHHVDNWILSTVTSITKRLILVFNMNSYPQSSHTESDFYKFPFEVLLSQKNLSLEYLQLEFVSAKLPLKFDGFTTLRTLKLNCPDLTQEDVHKLLISCPLLEFLKIQGCRTLVALQISTPLPRLRILILQTCDKLRKIELWAENLSCFDYDRALRMDHIMLKGCYNLTKVAARSLHYVDGVHLRPLSTDFPFVTSLYLVSRLKDLCVVLRDNIFAHLKFLAIFLNVTEDERNIQYLSSLLNIAAPVLEELELHVLASGSAKRYKTNHQKIDCAFYNHLKRVAITGFTGETGQTTLAKYFVMRAIRLQVMTLDPLCHTYQNFDAIGNVRFPRRINKRCRDAYKYLCEEVPENATLTLVGDK